MLNNILKSRKDLKSKIQIDVSFPEIEKFDYLPTTKTNKASAFVSIMEGCSKYCSFCVVPYTRGEEVSRPLDDVLNEIKNLGKQGVKEVNLLGQNVNSYQGLMSDGSVADLAFLITIIAQIDDIKRIRYTTSHPAHFDDNLIDIYAQVPKLVAHLHLPIQSGSDKILSLMKRGHMAIEYKSKIRKLRKIRPDISISSDFIIGFPGETNQDFNDTMDIINEIGFDKSFSFIYSPRPGTPASNYTDDISIEIKKKRLALVQKTIDENTQKISKSMIGSKQKVLVEALANKGGGLYGKTENMRNTHFQGDKNLIGQIVDVKIIDAQHNSLVAKLINNFL